MYNTERLAKPEGTSKRVKMSQFELQLEDFPLFKAQNPANQHLCVRPIALGPWIGHNGAKRDTNYQ